MFKLRHYTVSLAHFEFDGNTSQKMKNKQQLEEHFVANWVNWQ